MINKLKEQIKNFHYREIEENNKQGIESLFTQFFNSKVEIVEGYSDDVCLGIKLDDVIKITLNNKQYWLYLDKVENEGVSYHQDLITIQDIDEATDIDNDDSINYLTTKQFIRKLKLIKNIKWYDDCKIIVDEEDNHIDVYIRDNPDSEEIYTEVYSVGLHVINQYEIYENFLMNLCSEDQTKFLSLLLRYTQTPVEFR